MTSGPRARPPLEPDARRSVRGPVPGPGSRALAARLRGVESRNVTRIADDSPIFWEAARGAAVRDVDGNVFTDLSAGFGVAMAGHAHPAVASAIAQQASRLAHGLGDVHPSEVKVRLLERLAQLAPGDLGVAILGSAGAEGVEAAIKTALLRTGRSAIVAFEGAYHGLTFGALALTHRAEFREPFLSHLQPHVRWAPFPDEQETDAATALTEVARTIEALRSEGSPVGAIIIEPILGRGGLIAPPAGFLAGLRELCDGEHCLLIFDEIYTGIGRTGRWFACEHEQVVPDVLVVGKALTGSLPLSAAIGTPAVMDAWPASRGEAIHTSTFLGNPVACAAALAHIGVIEKEGLLDRARIVGDRIGDRMRRWSATLPDGGRLRGRGLLRGFVPANGSSALDIAAAALGEGVIVLAEGTEAEALALTPPAVIANAQLEDALDVLEALLARN